MSSRFIRFLITYPAFSIFLLISVLVGGVLTIPISFTTAWLPDLRLSVDALPEIGNHQQIVHTNWEGKSPEEIERQITYPLLTHLMGLPGFKSSRSVSMFGRSSIYLSFDENKDVYWCRSRILEKLNAIPTNLLPVNVEPKLGPNASALGQIYWYSLEAQDGLGQVVDTWPMEELRQINDYYIRYGLQAEEGVAEVSSIGGWKQTFHIQLDPNKMKSLGVQLNEVIQSVRFNNRNTSGHTLEVNRMEYFIRGVGAIENIEDLNLIAVKNIGTDAVFLKDIANIKYDRENRRGILNKAGKDVVGGVVTMEYGANPTKVIKRIESKLAFLKKGLPQKKLENGQKINLKIIPFYNRAELVKENINTLHRTLFIELLIVGIVIFFMMRNWQAAIVIGSMLPFSIALTYLSMRIFNIPANSLSLAGIAIAIGSIVDMGIIWLDHLIELKTEKNTWLERLVQSASEIFPAIFTATATTIISFLPIIWLQGTEGQLFSPLAITKTIVLVSSFFILFSVLPVLAYFLLQKKTKNITRTQANIAVVIGIILLAYFLFDWETNIGVSILRILLFVGVIFGFQQIRKLFPRILSFIFQYHKQFRWIPFLIIGVGIFSWWNINYSYLPKIDEGAFLLMPTVPDHLGETEIEEILQLLDKAIAQIPEIKEVVGKAGHIDSALDPAPLTMLEILIQYKPEYEINSRRIWRKHIRNRDDIWEEIISIVKNIPGLSIPPKLQPIETRLLMLQSGIRSSLGIKVFAKDSDKLNFSSKLIEQELRKIPQVDTNTIFVQDWASKPYLDIHFKREQIARLGLNIETVQQYIEIILGKKGISEVELGRNHYLIQLGFPKHFMQQPESLNDIPITLTNGKEVLLGDVAEIRFKKGPMMINGEDGFLTQTVYFNPQFNIGEIKTAAFVNQHLDEHSSEILNGVSYKIEGNFQDFIRSKKQINLFIIISIMIITIIIYGQFLNWRIVSMILGSILLAVAGGMIGLNIYNSINIEDTNDILLNIPVAIGFLALLGIAVDDGVLMATFIKKKLEETKVINTKEQLQQLIIGAGNSRIKPAMMTTATTLLALLPIFWDYGKGIELMRPLAIPLLAGLCFQVLTVFWIPLLFYRWKLKLFIHE